MDFIELSKLKVQEVNLIFTVSCYNFFYFKFDFDQTVLKCTFDKAFYLMLIICGYCVPHLGFKTFL